MKNGDILRSWKEISAYLECDRRTCLRWEKSLGLPIHRMEGSEKGGVFAYRDELDKWLAQRTGQHEPAKNGTEVIEAGRKWARLESRRWSRKRLLSFHLVVWAAIIAAFILFGRRPAPRVPVDFRIDGSELVVLGSESRELFRFETGIKNLLDTDSYRRSVRDASAGVVGGWNLPFIGFHDIDLDGRRETLFTVQTRDEVGEGVFFCLDTRGRPRWIFKAGRELKFGALNNSADYRICGFDLNDLDQDGKREIQLFSTHRPDWPCQFVNLGSDGKVLGEFWNSGYLTDFIVADITGDGRSEIILGGLNNEYGEGVVIVFDATDVHGSSPQTDPRFRCESLGPGSEKFYVRLPRTDAEADAWPVESIEQSVVTQSRELSFKMLRSGVFFEFDFGLDLRRIRNSHQFMQLHKAAVDAGRVKSVLDDDYLKALGAKVLYWDGTAKAWTFRKAMANTW